MTTHPQGQLALKDIADLAEVSRPAVSNWKARYPTFPTPVEDSPARRPLFEFSEVLTWLESEDLLPDTWQTNAMRLIITSAINPLTIATSNTAAAALLSLAILAAHKHSDGTLQEEWATITNAGDVLTALTQILSRLDHDLLSSDDIARLVDNIRSAPPSTLHTLVSGLAQVNKDNYSTAARIIIDTFFGSGGRSTYSQYATTTSAASSLIANAAGTTVIPGATIFDPTCGIAGTLLALHNLSTDLSLVGNDIDRMAVTIASLQTYLADIPATFTHANILTNDPHPQLQAHTIISEPPFGMRLEDTTLTTVTASLQTSLGITVPAPLAADAAFLTYPLHHLAPEGRAYVLTNLSTCSQGRLAQFRQNLIARGAVEAIIQLPRKLLTYTSLATALWVLRAPDATRATEPVLLADASNAKDPADHIAEWLHAMREGRDTTIPTGSTTLAEMITQDSTLLPSLLLNRAPDKGKVLADYKQAWNQLTDTVHTVSDTLSAQASSAEELPASSTVLPLTELGSVTRIRARYRKTDEEPTDGAIAAQLIPFRDRGEPAEQVFIGADTPTVQPGDLLIPNQSGVPARVFTTNEGTWVAPTGMFVLRVTGDQFEPEYLAACVNAPFNEVDDGGMIARRKLSQIQIPLLSLPEQQKLLATTSQLQQLADQAQKLHRQAEAASAAAMNVIRYDTDTP